MTRIAFVGGGNMAFALVQGLRARSAFDIVVSDPVPEQLARFEGVSTTPDNAAAVAGADAVVLAVKPQHLAAATAGIALDAGQLVVSIAAGVPIDALAGWTSPRQPIVRCMPNTPALLGAGITGAVPNAVVGDAHRRLAGEILAAAGEVVWFEDEASLDAVTAVSGSGPAYVFYLLEAMIDAGVALGFDAGTARRLAVATALGAARMADADDADPATLRTRVTSPGGTTERALSILASNEVDAAVRQAIHGAWLRSRELAEEFGK